MKKIQLTFLGTGGGRYATILQKRKTGGIRLDTEERNIHIDPGPGALTLSHKNNLDPTKLDTIVLTHSHTDHYNDTEVLIEAMTEGGTKSKGDLITTKTGIEEVNEYGPAISKYHRKLPNKLWVMNKKEKIKLTKNIELIPKKVRHSEPTTCGFIIKTNYGKIGFTSDTEYYPSIKQDFSDCRILIMNLTRPINYSIPHHLSTEDAIKLLKQISPNITMMTHLGMKMIQKGPKKEARKIEEKTDKKCIAAQDGMKLKIKQDIQIEETQKKLTSF